MKKIISACFLLCFVLASCKKDNANGNVLTGKWILKATGYTFKVGSQNPYRDTVVNDNSGQKFIQFGLNGKGNTNIYEPSPTATGYTDVYVEGEFTYKIDGQTLSTLNNPDGYPLIRNVAFTGKDAMQLILIMKNTVANTSTTITEYYSR
ncbi:hypothetical protein ACFS5N_01735 [Mucilaginibacter ximonensis]|uniref:Lipocalin-like domain-containing protein n=1 Tax=Mucilaginibacter ximonensis TaxID=538021 RepID=A0ABW5Y735_9SPHI